MLQAEPDRRFSAKIKDLLKGLLICVLVLLFLEGVARVAHTIVQNINEGQEPEWYVFSSDSGWEPKPGYKGGVYGVHREFDSEGYLLADTARMSNAGKVRVLFLGDSNTFGVTASTESTFARQLESLAPNISSINLGVPGYTSFQGLQTFLKKGLKVNPEIVVISFNFNDRRYVLSPEDVDSAASFQKLHENDRLEQLARLLRTSYVYRSIQALFRKLRITRDDAGNAKVRLDRLPARVEPGSYRENLVRMVELARSRNIEPVFLLLKDNPVQTDYLRKGIELLDSSQRGIATEYLKVTDYWQPWFSALSRIHLARIHVKDGRPEEAEKILTIVPTRSLHGGSPVHLDTDYNKIMKDVAAQYSVEVVDAGRVLDAHPSDYVDFCHFNSDGHKRIAVLLHDRLPAILSRRRTPGTQ